MTIDNVFLVKCKAKILLIDYYVLSRMEQRQWDGTADGHVDGLLPYAVHQGSVGEGPVNPSPHLVF